MVFVVLVVLGVLTGLSPLAVGVDVAGSVIMGLFGVLVAAVGLSALRSKVRVEGDVLHHRFARTRRFAASDVRALSFDVHGRGGNLYGAVDRMSGERVWLPALSRRDTRGNRVALKHQLQALRKALNLA